MNESYYKNGDDLISRFVGKKLEYHKMPDKVWKHVIPKIEEMGYEVWFSSRQTQIYDSSNKMVIDADFTDEESENTYQAVVSFIEMKTVLPNDDDDYPICGFILAQMGFDYDYIVYSKGHVWLAERESRGGQMKEYGIFLNGLSGGCSRSITTIGELKELLKIELNEEF